MIDSASFEVSLCKNAEVIFITYLQLLLFHSVCFFILESHSRGKKKRTDLLIQLLTLFKIFKVKVLVAVALAGIFFIKKILILAAIYLPSVLHSLKMSCRPTVSHAYHAPEEFHGGFEADYGSSYAGHSAYGKDW